MNCLVIHILLNQILSSFEKRSWILLIPKVIHEGFKILIVLCAKAEFESFFDILALVIKNDCPIEKMFFLEILSSL